MKIKKIIDVCKASGTLILFDSGGEEQWISNGLAMYPLYGMPPYDAKTVCLMYDIDEKKMQEMHLENVMGLPQEYDFRDAAPGEERELDRGNAGLMLHGRWFVPFFGEIGEVLYINREFLKPIQEEGKQTIGFFRRKTAGGVPYVVVKQGLLLQAVILPHKDAGATVQDVSELNRVARDLMRHHSLDDDRQYRMQEAEP